MFNFENETPLYWTDALAHRAMVVPDRTKEGDTRRWFKATRVGYRSTVTREYVKLEWYQTAAGPHTTKEALDRFLARLNGQTVTLVAPVASVAANAALAELASAGIR